jgi:hypothetical protein
MDVLSRPVRLTGWRLLIGPPDLSEPTPSWAVYFLPRYEPDEVAAAILAVPGCSLVSPAEPDWEHWAARWEVDGRMIGFGRPEVLEFDTDTTPGWAGCDLEAECWVGDVLAVWEAIHRRFPGIWLYNRDSWYQTRESFIEACRPAEPDSAADRPRE